MASSSTIKIQDTLNWANQFCGNILVGAANTNNPNQPALSIAQIVQETMLQPPLVWRWNRAVTGFVCTAGVQDYTVGSWLAGTAEPLNFLVVDSNGNSQQVTTPGTTGSSLPAWNTTKGQTTTDNGVTWMNLGPVGGSPNTSYNFFWTENASVLDIGPAAPKWVQISSKIDLSLDSAQSRPQNISAQRDGNVTPSIITWRMMPVPDKAYPVSITVQQKPLVYISLNQQWNIPDELATTFQTGFLAWAKFFQGDTAGYQIMHQQFIARILAACTGLDATQKNIFLSANQTFGSAQATQMMSLQQGLQGRAT